MKTDKIERGIVNYIDREIVPNIQEGMTFGSGKLSFEVPASMKRVLVGTAGAVLAKKASGMITTYFPPNENGEVDLEEIKNALVSRMPDTPMPIKLGDILEMNLTKNDVNELYRYIQNA